MNTKDLTLKEVVSLLSDIKLARSLMEEKAENLTEEEMDKLKLLKIRIKIVLDFFLTYDEIIKNKLLFNPNSSKGKETYYAYEYEKKLTYAKSPKSPDQVDTRNVYKDLIEKQKESDIFEELENEFWRALTLVKSKVISPTLTFLVKDNTVPGEAGAPYGVVKILNLSREDIVNRMEV